MAIEDQVKVLEDEFKLLKSEMKQTLVNVRDFLLDLRIPPMQEEKEIQADPPQAPAAQQPQQYSQERPRNDSNYPDMSGQGQMPQPQANSVVEPFSPPADEMPASGFEDQVAFGEEEITDEPTTVGDFPMEKEPTMSNFDGAEHARHDTVPGETGPMPSQVNLLANLIRWVASAKKEIGIEQLPVFLNVYAITGKLSPEMKDVILHLAEVATDPTTDGVPMDRMGLIREQLALFMKLNALNGQNPPPIDETIARLAELLVQQSTYANKANLWSQLLLELNGILGNGNISLHLLTAVGLQDDGAQKAESNTEETVPEEPPTEDDEEPMHKKGKSARLRLVLPNDSGEEQELDLGELLIAQEKPKHDGNGHKKVSVSRGS